MAITLIAVGCGAGEDAPDSPGVEASPAATTVADAPAMMRIPVTEVGADHWDSPILSAKPPEIVATTYRVVGDVDVSDVRVQLLERAEGFYVRVSYVVDSVRGSGAIEIVDSGTLASSGE